MTAVPEEVVVESLAAGGAGVAHLADGMTVFVPRTAPGDRVRLRDVRRRRRHAQARVGELLSPGPERVEPRCSHFLLDACGGCQWQHVSAAAQAASKRRMVGDALRRIAKLEMSDPELVESPRRLGYRATVTLTVRREGGVIAGFHREDDPEAVFALDRCEIARPEVQGLWEAVRGSLDCLPGGADVRLKLRVSGDGSLHVVVAGGDGAWTNAGPLARAAAAAGAPATIWWQPLDGAVRRLAGEAAAPSAVGFEQVNADVATLLREAVVKEAVGLAPRERAVVRALDLYAGTGETALALADRGWDVSMVEVNARAVRRARDGAARAGLDVRCVAARVEDALGRLLPADVVVVNPPRAGLSEAVASELAAQHATAIVYVSCDPATLARDLVRLGLSEEDIIAVRCFDMFPQTSHVETVVAARPGPA